jgi:hypothetical protein
MAEALHRVYIDAYTDAYKAATSTGGIDEEAHLAGVMAVAHAAEDRAIERASSPETMTGIAAEQVAQLTRIANALNSSPDLPTFDADRVIEAWEATGMRMHEDKAIALLERLGFTVDRPERTRVV